MMTDTDRWRNALHESAHFVAGLLLRGEVAAVLSIRPGKSHLGLTLASKRSTFDFGGRRDDPLRVDPEFRRSIEAAIVMLLAGKAAEVLASQSVGRLEEPEPTGDEQRAAARRALGGS
jgi:ATP-dependent Zn protease